MKGGNKMTKEQMWAEYLKVNPQAKSYEAWQFGGTTEEMPNILAQLVLKGEKTATASAYPLYQAENAPLPSVNAFNIILDLNEEAVCMIKTTKVYVLPFCEVPSAHALKEGEGDKSLTYWKNAHAVFFERELAQIGMTFSEDMLVVCEEFERVYPIKEDDI